VRPSMFTLTSRARTLFSGELPQGSPCDDMILRARWKSGSANLLAQRCADLLADPRLNGMECS
jgi:hypothetical protein